MRLSATLALTAALCALLAVGAACAPRTTSQKPAVAPAPPGTKLQLESPVQGEVGAEFGDRLQLISYQLSTSNPGPGDGLDIELRWRSLAPLTDDHRAFVELLDEHGEEIAGDDDIIGTRANATSGWAPGTEGTHRPGLTIPRSYPPGRYELRVGVLEADRKTRLPLSRPAGLDVGDDWVTIGVLRSE